MSGMFYRSDMSMSGIETLLNDLETPPLESTASQQLEDSPPAADSSVPGRPTIIDFLDEEDITRECRSDNKRLITYLCRPEIVKSLILICMNITPSPDADLIEPILPLDNNVVPPPPPSDRSVDRDEDAPGVQNSSLDGSAQGNATGNRLPDSRIASDNAQVAADSDSGNEVENEEVRKRRMARSYIASELLSADVTQLAEAVVRDDEIVDILLSCLEMHAPGELDAFVASHFAKIIISLLKTLNGDTLAQLARRRDAFVRGLLKHVYLLPIAELIVRILDGGDVDRGQGSAGFAPPRAAIELLVATDVLNGLANCFVSAAKPVSQPESTDARRLREETMSHATMAINGISHRVLQLPALGIDIPALLSPYHTPRVVMGMLVIGLETNAASAELASSSPTELPGECVVPSNSGASAALFHALSLAATLMTTDGNVVRNDSDGMGAGSQGIGGAPGMGRGPGLAVMGGGYAGLSRGGGIAASIQREHERRAQEAAGLENESSDPDDVDESEASLPNPPTPEVGSPITSTLMLEVELATKFKRLSEMFGSDVNDEAEGRPLGSLRLKLAEFFVACMKKSSQTTVDAIVHLGVPKKLSTLFLRYEWSSMLHGVVTRSILSAFEGTAEGAPARKAWMNAGLISWLTTAWAVNEQKANDEEFRFRAGYMGHLIQIGHNLRMYIEEFPEEAKGPDMISDEDMKKFLEFADAKLVPAYKVEITALGGERPDNAPTSEGEDVYEDEEATEVFDMGEVVEGLSQGDEIEAKIRIEKLIRHRSLQGSTGVEIYDDDVIEPVDVSNIPEDSDLSHFGPDDDATSPVHVVAVDHDIPESMRASLESGQGTSASASVSDGNAGPVAKVKTKELNAETHEGNSDPSNNIVMRVQSMDMDDSEVNAILAGKDQSSVPTAQAGAASVSDDDDGSYAAYVDAPGDSDTSLARVAEEKLRLDSTEKTAGTSPEVLDQSDVADIVEVEDPVTPKGAKNGKATVGQGSGGSTILPDDSEDSSGDDGDGYVLFNASEFVTQSGSPVAQGTSEELPSKQA